MISAFPKVRYIIRLYIAVSQYVLMLTDDDIWRLYVKNWYGIVRAWSLDPFSFFTTMNKPLVNITDWAIVPALEGFDPCWVLLGIPSNHPNHLPEQRVSNIRPIITSRIVYINYIDFIVETLNTKYKLNGPLLNDLYQEGKQSVQDSKGKEVSNL